MFLHAPYDVHQQEIRSPAPTRKAHPEETAALKGSAKSSQSIPCAEHAVVRDSEAPAFKKDITAFLAAILVPIQVYGAG